MRGRRRLGFVVHGLWPQNERGFPAIAARPAARPRASRCEQAEGLFPTEGLARYEWRKHGTCSGSSPSDYFADVRRARDEGRDSRRALAKAERDQSWTAIDLERAFVAANPGLRTDMMSVACKRGVLQEVRICLEQGPARFPDAARRSERSRLPHRARSPSPRRADISRKPAQERGMNYRHGFHAGNFADVLKHVVLTRILSHLDAQGHALSRRRHPCRRRPLRPRLRGGAARRMNGRTASRGSTVRRWRPPSRRCSSPGATRVAGARALHGADAYPGSPWLCRACDAARGPR